LSVCPHHVDLVHHEQVKRVEQLDFVTGKAPLVVDTSSAAEGAMLRSPRVSIGE